MNLFIPTALLLLLSAPTIAQELLPARLPINEAIRRELAMGSIPEDTSVRSSPPDYYSQPLFFRRASGKFKPDATVRYYFSRIDSLPFRIEYVWDANWRQKQWDQIEPLPNVIEPMSRLPEYNARYESLRDEMIGHYGAPHHRSDTLHFGHTERGNRLWGRGDLWEEKGMKIHMYMHFADSTWASGLHRIVINQEWGQME